MLSLLSYSLSVPWCIQNWDLEKVDLHRESQDLQQNYAMCLLGGLGLELTIPPLCQVVGLLPAKSLSFSAMQAYHWRLPRVGSTSQREAVTRPVSWLVPPSLVLSCARQGTVAGDWGPL